MANLSSFYPQPVVKGTTAGTFAEGNDSRIVGAAQKSANLSDLASASTARANLDLEVGVDVAAFNDSRITGALPAATAGTGSVLASGSTTARTLSDRFSRPEVNVLDFGADPTGQTDSWLAIQRALRHAAGAPNAATETLSTTELIYGIQQPVLYFTSNATKVVFPKGTFRISRPIYVSQNTHLEGCIGQTFISPIITNNQAFNLIETNAVRCLREEFTTSTENFGSTAYCAGLTIRGITLQFPFENGQPITPQNYLWYCLPFYPITGIDPLTIIGTRPLLRVNNDSGSQGSTTVNVSTRNASFPEWTIMIGERIKFSNHATEYTVTQISPNNSITFSPALTQSASNAYVLIGIKACGIMVEGGENAVIDQCYINGAAGAGIFITNGSPSTVIRNCMANSSETCGYWIEAAPCTMEKPSGDNNQTFIRSGYFNYQSGLIVDSMKVESQFTRNSLLQFTTRAAGKPSKYVIIGGSVNCPLMSYNAQGAVDKASIDVWNLGPAANVIVQGCGFSGYGQFYYRERSAFNGQIFKQMRNSSPSDRDNFGVIAGRAAFFDSDPSLPWEENRANARFYLTNGVDGGIIGEKTFGIIDYSATVSRSGGVATFTTSINHNLEVGNHVSIGAYSSIAPSGSNGLVPDRQTGEQPDGFSTNVMRVISVPTPTTFTCNVKTSGSPLESASIVLSAYQLIWFHDIKNGEHRIQTPTMRGASDRQYRVLGVYDKLGEVQAGVRGYGNNEWAFWSSRGYDIGGTWKDNTYTPLSTIMAGNGIPSMSAPNGSLYLRTDGDASTTLYVRAGGAWKPVASWEP